MKCSLWLVPPVSASKAAVSSHDRLQRQIEEIASEHGGPIFAPHITIVSGVEVRDAKHGEELCEKLGSALKGKFQDGIECDFQDTLRSIQLDKGGGTGPLLWNQALVAVARRTKSLVELTRASRDVLGKPLVDDEQLFAPPLLEPHLSLFYGEGPLPPDITDCWPPPAPFSATELSLWSTTPTELVGVAHWEELCKVPIL